MYWIVLLWCIHNELSETSVIASLCWGGSPKQDLFPVFVPETFSVAPNVSSRDFMQCILHPHHLQTQLSLWIISYTTTIPRRWNENVFAHNVFRDVILTGMFQFGWYIAIIILHASLQLIWRLGTSIFHSSSINKKRLNGFVRKNVCTCSIPKKCAHDSLLLFSLC